MPRLIDALEQLFTVDSLASGPSLLINYSSLTGGFTVGETVTGGTSGATLVVKSSIEPQVTGDTVVGTFQVGETITGGTSGSTATVDNFFLYDFPAGAAPLENGEIDFFESGSSTVRKTTYSDAAETIPNANPLVIRGDGRVPNVYGSGTYRIVVRTSTGIQILARDPIGGDQGLTFGADWSASIVYSETDVVRDDGRYWQSITANNSGNQPSTDGGVNWIELPFDDISTNTADISTNTANIATNTADILEIQQYGIIFWDTLVTYPLGAWSRSAVDNEIYISLVASNTGNEPSASPAQWEKRKSTYSSGPIAIVSSGAVSLIHGLGAEPRFISYTLQCISAEHGYSVGDRIDVGLNSSTSATDRFTKSKKTTSEISIRFSNAPNVFAYAEDITGSLRALTNTSWELYVDASL